MKPYLRISYRLWSLTWASHTDNKALSEHLTQSTMPYLSISHRKQSLSEHLKQRKKPYLSISHWQRSFIWASHADNEALFEHLTLTTNLYFSISQTTKPYMSIWQTTKPYLGIWQTTKPYLSISNNEALHECLVLMKFYLSFSCWQWCLTWASHMDNEALSEHLTHLM